MLFRSISKISSERIIGRSNSFSHALLITVLCGFLSSLFFFFISNHPFWQIFFHVEQAQAKNFNLCIRYLGVLVTFNAIFVLSQKLLLGYYKQLLANSINLITSCFSTLALYLFSSLKEPLPILFASQLIIPGFFGIITIIWVNFREPTFTFIKPSAHKIKELITLGRLFFFLQIAVSISYQIDVIIVGHFLGASESATYSMVWKFFLLPCAFFATAVSPLWPAFSNAMANKNTNWIKQIFRKAFIATLSLSIIFSIISIFFSSGLIRIWSRDQINMDFSLMLGMSIWIIVFALTQPISMLLNALHEEKVILLTSILAGSLNITLSSFLILYFKNSSGAIWGSVICQTLFFVVPQYVWINRKILNS